MQGGLNSSCKRYQHILRKKRSPTSLNELTRKGNPQSKWVSERGLVIHPYRRRADNSNKLWTTLLLKRALVAQNRHRGVTPIRRVIRDHSDSGHSHYHAPAWRASTWRLSGIDSGNGNHRARLLIRISGLPPFLRVRPLREGEIMEKSKEEFGYHVYLLFYKNQINPLM